MESQLIKATQPLRGLLIGFGFISSQGHFPCYAQRKDVAIVAIIDRCEARLKKARELAPHIPTFLSFEEFLDSGISIDFVDIATPPAFHFEYIQKSINIGAHVLCEKPLTSSLEEAQKVLDLAKNHQKVIFPCHNYKFAPVIQAVQNILDSGEIGNLRHISLQTFRTTHARGVPEWNTHWRRQKEFSGGGIAMDHGSHTFYLMFHWLKAYPTTINSQMWNLLGVSGEKSWQETEDHFVCTALFPGNRVATSLLSWTAGTRKVQYNLQGEKGSIFVDDDLIKVYTNQIQLTSTGTTTETRTINAASHWQDASHVEWFNSLFDQFTSCINKNKWVSQDLLDSYHCIQMIMKSYESAKNQGLQIRLPEQGRGDNDSKSLL